MSVQAVSWVFEYSEAKLGSRLVFLALANHAHADGTNCWASVATLAGHARLSERQARRCLRSLEQMGEIQRTGTHPSGTRVYRIPGMQDGQIDREGTNEAAKVPDLSPEPSEPVREANASLTPPSVRKRKPDKLWDLLVEELGPVQTKSERGRRNRALRELREIGVNEDDLRGRIASYRRRWPEIELTATGIAANWTVLGQPRTVLREVRGSHGSTFIEVAV